tara:strand:+ start:376 stop:1950 length:1575 start_codon:yes stop_codon:yes gene_type:complete
MTDTLKEFSNLSGKTLSELTAGVTLLTTSGSEKAVIKGISIQNDNGRDIAIRLNSTTGTKIAGASNTVTLSGNEIVDNSQSIVAVTTQELVLTDLVYAGWGEYSYSNTNAGSDYMPVERLNSDGIHRFDTGADPIFSPDTWDEKLTYTGANNKVDFPASSNDDMRGKSWGESFEDKFGNVWVWGMAGSLDFEIAGQNKNENTLYKINNDSSQTAANNIKTFGSMRMGCYDGERYLYIFMAELTYLKKYDTWANPQTDTFTQVPLYDADTSDTTSLQIIASSEQCVCYYRDGLIVWFGGNFNNNTGNAFVCTDVSNGKTKRLYDTKYSASNNDRNGEGSSTCKRSIGMTKNSAGDYFAWIANWNTNNQSASGNTWQITNMGSDPATTFCPNGQSAKKTYSYDMWNVVGTPGGGDNSYYQMCYRLATVRGTQYNAPRGFTIWTPSIDRYNYLCSHKYTEGGNNTFSGYNFYKLDFDKVGSPTLGNFVVKLSSSPPGTGSLQLRKDNTKAASAFGTCGFRTTGILIT